MLIEKVTSVIRRMRWRAYYYLQREKDNEPHADEHYGLNSRKSPPYVQELEPFESDLTKLIENVIFRRRRDNFQQKLQKDIAHIKRSQSVFVPADKTRNLYELKKEQYNKLLTDNITKHYRTADGGAYNDINAEALEIANKLEHNLAERMETMAKKEAYITLKDHKDNFADRLPCRLINPAKPEMGVVSKHILDSINGRLKEMLDVTMWKNSMAVIEWFQKIEDKNSCIFVCFDITEFYPPISEELLQKALTWADKHTEISERQLEVIYHSRKSLLFSNDKTWMKRDSSGFDVTMGSYDGVEVCELIGTFALAQLPKKYRTGNVGLYRDDGLGVFRRTSGSQADRIRKDLETHFKKLGLRITIETNLKITNFLDLTLNLNNGKYYPYRKPNDIPVYINKMSNHPPTILKELPAAISRRLTDISHDEGVFHEAAPLYNDALERSGYTEKVAYATERKAIHTNLQCKRNRRRKITWFNPPFSKDVATDIGRRFLCLIDKHFPQKSKLHQVFNRNTVKVSYSCTPNVGAIIKRHNLHVCAEANNPSPPKLCNCRRPDECPLEGECLASSIVYQATVTTGAATEMHYIGSTETTFKVRYGNHKASITHASKANQTELSKYVWQLKREKTDYRIAWKILRRAHGYTNASRRCDLCLTEKLLIAKADKRSLLNKRSELASKCRHQNKFYLSNFVRAPT